MANESQQTNTMEITTRQRLAMDDAAETLASSPKSPDDYVDFVFEIAKILDVTPVGPAQGDGSVMAYRYRRKDTSTEITLQFS